MPHTEYHARRKQEALPRWEEAFDMRQKGQKLREIAAKFSTCPARVSRMIESFREHQFNKNNKSK